MARCLSPARTGFTVVELLVVLAVMALLLSVAAPRYVEHLDRSREVALKHNLRQVREAIDKFYADHARYPTALDELVQRRYLRALPVDPITERGDRWVIVPPPPPAAATAGVYDIRSGTAGAARDGSLYASW